MASKLIIVGGFLGAGKTTLLSKAAGLLQARGKKVGLITNDQASELVDTLFLETVAETVQEVSGSCFCCNFNGFAGAINEISTKNGGGIILAEPVGSCTDLSATLMQPVKDKYRASVDLAPLTVLVDPSKLQAILSDKSSSGTYIMAKQLEEADIILITKTDLISHRVLNELITGAKEKWPQTRIMTASVTDDESVSQWLDTILHMQQAGRKIVDVDYDIYAAGEAAYGWVNTSFVLEQPAANMKKSAEAFLSSLKKRFEAADIQIGHVKFLLRGANKLYIGNLTDGADDGSLRIFNTPVESATLTVNARAETSPEILQKIVLREVSNVFNVYQLSQIALNSLIPGRPNPTYRYHDVKE